MLGFFVSFPLLFAQAPAAGGPAASPAAPAVTPAAPATGQPAPAAATTAPATGQPATAPPAGGQAPPASPFSSLIMFLPVIVLFYLMILRPQQKQERQRKEMINQVERNARVVTTGGIYGTVVAVDKDSDTISLRLGSDPGVKVEFARAAIARVIDGSAKDKKDADRPG